MNKVVKSTWLCFARDGATREEVWVRGQIRPYKDAVNQVASAAGELIWNTNFDFEIWLQELPTWTTGKSEDGVYVYFEIEPSLTVEGQFTWGMVVKVRNFTLGVRRKKMFSVVVSTSGGVLPISDNSPPALPSPQDVQSLEEAELHLRNTVIAATSLVATANNLTQ